MSFFDEVVGISFKAYSKKNPYWLSYLPIDVDKYLTVPEACKSDQWIEVGHLTFPAVWPPSCHHVLYQSKSVIEVIASN